MPIQDAYERRAKVLRIVDGDTMDVELDLGFDIRVKQRLRLLDVDTPEVYGVKHGSVEHQRGLQASEFTNNWMTEHAERKETTVLSPEKNALGLEIKNVELFVQLRSHKSKRAKGKYGRYLCEVYPGDGEGQSLNEALNVWMAEQDWDDE